MIMERSILPILLSTLFFLTLTVELAVIAESASIKVIDMGNDMNDAVECAVKGVDLKICTPDIYNHNFINETRSTIDLINETKTKIEENNIK